MALIGPRVAFTAGLCVGIAVGMKLPAAIYAVGDARQRLHQEVCRSHSGLDRSKGMLDRFPPHPHGLRVLVEPALDGLQNRLVFPSRDASLHAGRAALLDGAGPARVVFLA